MVQLPQIRLESQTAKISLTQTPGRQEIRQPRAELSIEQPKANLSIQTTPGKLTVDQTRAWEDMNLPSPLRSVAIAANQGVNALMEGIQRRTQQGADLMEIENGGEVIAYQAEINGHEQTKLIGLKYIPSHFSVDINYQPGNVQIDAQANQPIINSSANRPEHNYQAGKVDVQMERYNSLDIDFTNIYSETI